MLIQKYILYVKTEEHIRHMKQYIDNCILQLFMQELIKVKNIKGKQSRKKWKKNIDVTGLMQNIQNAHTAQMREQYNKKNQNLLVVEDTRLIKKKPLQPNRFKKKVRDPKLQSKTEKIIIKKINLDDIKPKPIQNSQQQLFDAWGIQPVRENIHSKKQSKQQDVKIPAVMIPIGGQSYNPNQKDFVELVDKIIEIEGPQKLDIRPRKTKVIQKVQVRSRNKKVRFQQLQALRRKQQKKFDHQFVNLKKIKKQILDEEQKIENTINRAKKLKQKLRQQKLTGRIKTGPRLSRRRYQFKQDIVPDIEPVPLSKQQFRQQVIKERFDSIYRRGIFEPKKYTMQTNQRRNIKVKKVKNDEEKIF